MIPALLGTKIGMTQVLGERGVVEPVTVIKAGPCVAFQVKTPRADGYHAVQLGFEDVKPHRSTKPMIGHAGKAGTGPKRFVREIRLEGPAEVSQGDVLTVERFAEGKVQFVDVTGTAKGKGFQGVMKRHGFGGMCNSHGTERKHRSPGGIGAHAPRGTGRSVKKGKRMAGHMGDQRRTIGPLRLLGVDTEHDLLLVRGSVPGANGSLVIVRRAKKKG
jgi:large subunit ribosomal protein L3